MAISLLRFGLPALLALLAAAAAYAGETPKARAFLETLDPALVRNAPAARALLQKAASIAGVDELGTGWFKALTASKTKSLKTDPPVLDGLFVGEEKGWVTFALPLGRPLNPAKLKAFRNGRPLSEVRYEAAPDGRATLVSFRDDGRACQGVTLSVRTADGILHGARRPPDEVELFCETTIERKDGKTRITTRPSVTHRSPGGKSQKAPPGRGPGGQGKTAVRAKEEDGFFEKLLGFLGRTSSSLLIGMGTGLVMSELTASKKGHVRVDATDGTCTIEVPDEVYDDALNTAIAQNPNYGAQDIGKGFDLVIMESRPAETASAGWTVTRYYATGGSVYTLRPGQSVVFHLSGKGPAPTYANTRVPLLMDGCVRSYLTVTAVGRDGHGPVVSTRLASTTQGLSGLLQARVEVGGRASKPVPLGLSRNAFEIRVLQSVVQTGTSVLVVVENQSGGPIQGTLVLAGPGRFARNGSTRLAIDTAGSRVTETIHTTSAGQVNVRFDPK
jgi:hypothetical protein